MPAKHARLLYVIHRFLSTHFFEIFLITADELPFSPVFSCFLILALKKLKNNSKKHVVRCLFPLQAIVFRHKVKDQLPV